MGRRGVLVVGLLAAAVALVAGALLSVRVAQSGPAGGQPAQVLIDPTPSLLDEPAREWLVRPADLAGREAAFADVNALDDNAPAVLPLPGVVVAGVEHGWPDNPRVRLAGLDPRTGETMWLSGEIRAQSVSCHSLDGGSHVACSWRSSEGSHLWVLEALTGEVVADVEAPDRVLGITGWGNTVITVTDGEPARLWGGPLADPFGGWSVVADDGGDTHSEVWMDLGTDGRHVFLDISGAFTTVDLDGNVDDPGWTKGRGEGSTGVSAVALGEGRDRWPIVSGPFGEYRFFTANPDLRFEGAPWGEWSGEQVVHDGLVGVGHTLYDLASGEVVRELGEGTVRWVGPSVLEVTSQVGEEWHHEYQDARTGEVLWSDDRPRNRTLSTGDAFVSIDETSVLVRGSRTGETAWEGAFDGRETMISAALTSSGLVVGTREGLWGFSG